MNTNESITNTNNKIICPLCNQKGDKVEIIYINNFSITNTIHGTVGNKQVMCNVCFIDKIWNK